MRVCRYVHTYYISPNKDRFENISSCIKLDRSWVSKTWVVVHDLLGYEASEQIFDKWRRAV